MSLVTAHDCDSSDFALFSLFVRAFVGDARGPPAPAVDTAKDEDDEDELAAAELEGFGLVNLEVGRAEIVLWLAAWLTGRTCPMRS